MKSSITLEVPMDVTTDLQRLREKAENYYMAGDFYCSETVLKVISESFATELPEEIVSLASAFPHGLGGSGCICGALVGGTMALGMLFGRSAAKEDEKVKKAMELSSELHSLFKKKHKVPCCRILTKGFKPGSPEQKQQCARFAGEVTEETAKMIIREKGAAILRRQRED
jgi:C_GCAxxG_C_C family probable redox protein